MTAEYAKERRLVTSRGILKLATAAGAGVLIGDAVSNRVGYAGYINEMTPGSRNATTMNVLHPGLFSMADLQADALQDHGFQLGTPTIAVGPAMDSRHYSADDHVQITVEEVAQAAEAYPKLSRVALNGISMGGRTALDSANELARLGVPDRHEFSMSLTVLDAPTTWKDINLPAIAHPSVVSVLARYPAGRVVDTVRRTLGFNWLNVDEAKDAFGEGADIMLWEIMQQSGNEMATSLVLDQLRSLAVRKPLTPEEFANIISVVFIGSENDTLINHDSAQAGWIAACEDGGALYADLTVDDATHSSLANFLPAYQQAFRHAELMHDLDARIESQYGRLTD